MRNFILFTVFSAVAFGQTCSSLVFNPVTHKLDCIGASGGAPTGAAGGVLSGTYPNPGFATSPSFTGTLTVGTSLATNTTTVGQAQYTGDFANEAYDATSGGSYADGALNPAALFELRIVNPGTPDQFQWRKNGGAWSTAANVTGLAQTLSNGVTVTFGDTTGDGTGDSWQFRTANAITGYQTLMSRGAAFGNTATIEESIDTLVSLSHSFTNASYAAGLNANFLVDATTDNTGFLALGTTQTVKTGNSKHYFNFDGNASTTQHRGTGTIDASRAVYGIVQNFSTGTISQAVGYYTGINNFAGGSIPVGYGYYVASPGNSGGGSFPLNTAFYASSQANANIANSYDFWADEQGVYRIKADNTFDSVYQAIPALYNPQFTKYTPGAVNYERLVQQWNGNVAEIGTQAGGTGTLRRMRFIGLSTEIPSIAFAALATPGNATENYCTDCTVTSGIDDTCAAAGSGAFAFRINGVWKCNI